MKIRVHEQTEMLEAAEAEAKVTITRIKQDMTEPRVPFEKSPDAARKAPPSTMRILRERYKAEGETIRRQREDVVKTLEARISGSEQRIAQMKKSYDSELQKMIEADVNSCVDDCTKRGSTSSVACMSRARVAAEVPPCLTDRERR